MVKISNYIPILKGKRGELTALNKLKEIVKTNITPLIDIDRIEKDFIEDPPKPKLSMDEHVARRAKSIEKLWGSKRPLFIDFFDIPLNELTKEGKMPIEVLMGILRNSGMLAIPTTGLDRDANYNNAIKSIIEEDERGLCLRLQKEDMVPTGKAESGIANLLETINVKTNQVHLLLDFRSCPDLDLKKNADIASKVINSLPSISRYQSLIIAGSSIPASVSEIVKNNSTILLKRTEWELWLAIRGMKNIKRVPKYADYGVSHPDGPPEIDFRIMIKNVNGKIRYTLNKTYLIARGEKLGGNYKQYHDLARRIVNHTNFSNSSFSWGDKYIVDCARNVVGHGNLETWIRVDANHHITFVVNQLANLSGTSVAA